MPSGVTRSSAVSSVFRFPVSQVEGQEALEWPEPVQEPSVSVFVPQDSVVEAGPWTAGASVPEAPVAVGSVPGEVRWELQQEDWSVVGTVPFPISDPAVSGRNTS